MISIKQLHYALAIEKSLHFKKAAEACNVSQSALSTSLNELEKQLGISIFERNNKQVLVTSKGQLILDKAKRVKAELDELLQVTQLDKTPFSTPMTLGVIPTIGPYLLPKVLPELRKQYPDFNLKIHEDQSHVLVDMVKKGDLDAAVLALPYPIDGLMSFSFWQEDFYWVSHKDELEGGLEEITTAELDLDKLMLLKDGHCLADHAIQACRLQPTVQKNTDFNATSLYTLIQMVIGKLGTTIVPQMALDQLIRHESELKAVHLNEPGPHRELVLIIRPNYVRTNELTLLRDIFTEQLTQKVAS